MKTNKVSGKSETLAPSQIIDGVSDLSPVSDLNYPYHFYLGSSARPVCPTVIWWISDLLPASCFR